MAAPETEQEACTHPSVKVEFDEEAAQHLDKWEIRKRWPRFSGKCPTCGVKLIMYASTAHFVYGDW